MKWVALLGMLASGCTAARLVGPVPITAPDPGDHGTVVLEPFFETAEWKMTVKTEIASVSGPNPLFGATPTPFANDVAVQTTVAEKPLFARVIMLAEEHRQVLAELQRLRPNWRVTSTGGAQVLTGPVNVVRVIVGDSELMGSNRTLKNLALGFGLLIWPLLIAAATPVEETHRIYGVLDRYRMDAEDLKGRLVRYPTQPDFAVNVAALPPYQRPYGLDCSYEEGLLVNEAPREQLLIRCFSLKLASAIVALVEEKP